MYRKLPVGWVVVFILFMAFSPSFALAQLSDAVVPCAGAVATDLNGDGDTSDAGEEACTICHIGMLAQNVLNTGIYIAVFISAILFAWAGWLHVTAGGDSSKVRSARRIFGNVLLGLVVILVGWIVVDTLMKLLIGENPAANLLKPWEPICD